MLEKIRSKKADPSRGPASIREDPEERLQRIAYTAYLRAKERGFAPGRELEDWLEAEREVETGGGK